MTAQKLIFVFDLYRTALVAAGFDSPKRTPDYDPSVGGDRLAAGNHLHWLAAEAHELYKKGKVAKMMRWLGFLQHGVISLGLFSLDDVKHHSADADETRFPPPAGMATVQAVLELPLVCGNCGQTVAMLVRPTWLPGGACPTGFFFPPIDPDGRLNRPDGPVEFTGPSYVMHDVYWNFTDLSYNVRLRPVALHPAVNSEWVGLLIGLLREAGWTHYDEESREWPERWAEHSTCENRYTEEDDADEEELEDDEADEADEDG